MNEANTFQYQLQNIHMGKVEGGDGEGMDVDIYEMRSATN